MQYIFAVIYGTLYTFIPLLDRSIMARLEKLFHTPNALRGNSAVQFVCTVCPRKHEQIIRADWATNKAIKRGVKGRDIKEKKTFLTLLVFSSKSIIIVKKLWEEKKLGYFKTKE